MAEWRQPNSKERSCVHTCMHFVWASACECVHSPVSVQRACIRVHVLIDTCRYNQHINSCAYNAYIHCVPSCEIEL
jgi:hypothetical protein